jgi:hypothetical protein
MIINLEASWKANTESSQKLKDAKATSTAQYTLELVTAKPNAVAESPAEVSDLAKTTTVKKTK